MSFLDEMRNLRSELNSSQKKRNASVEQIKSNTHSLQRQAAALIAELEKTRGKEARELKAKLKDYVGKMSQEVKTTRSEARQKQRELKEMFSQARTVFWGKGE